MSALVVAAGAAVVAGAALQSATGFGFALVAAPLLFSATDPERAVGLLIVLGAEVNLLTLAGERRRPAPLWPDTAYIVAWALPGALAGVALLRALDAAALQLAVTAGVLASLVVHRRTRAAEAEGPARVPAWALPAAGLASGALTTSTTTSGPPLVLYLLRRAAAPAQARDTLTASFLGLGAIAVLALAATGTGGAVPQSGWVVGLAPLVALGHLAGRPVFARVARGHYDGVLTAVMLVAVGVGLLTALI